MVAIITLNPEPDFLCDLLKTSESCSKPSLNQEDAVLTTNQLRMVMENAVAFHQTTAMARYLTIIVVILIDCSSIVSVRAFDGGLMLSDS